MAKVSVKSVVAKTKYRYLDDVLVSPVLYDGHNLGHGGSYMTGSVAEGKGNKLIVDDSGKPIHLKNIGEVR